MPDIRIVPLGAGQDVGRSCILVSIGNKNVMFDCGMHMGYNDERRFPDFNVFELNRQLLTYVTIKNNEVAKSMKNAFLDFLPFDFYLGYWHA